jgi:hypothetical protein
VGRETLLVGNVREYDWRPWHRKTLAFLPLFDHEDMSTGVCGGNNAIKGWKAIHEHSARESMYE